MKPASVVPAFLLIVAPLGCHGDAMTASLVPPSGIRGQVVRGPITPVCTVNQPCYAPFAATFFVEQGRRTVLTFHTDSTGRFLVHLAPGSYTIVPSPDAPIPFAASQAKTVQVDPGIVSTAQLTFDTGIR
jgi:hypothetical protein